MRVLHVIDDLGIGGAERLLLTLLPRLMASGATVEVAALGRRSKTGLEIERAGIPVLQFGLASPRSSLRASVRLLRLIRQQGYDLVHTHLAGANLAGRIAGALSGIPVTTTYHDCDYEPEVLLGNAGHSRWKQLAFQAADRATAVVCSRVVAVSDYVGRSIQRRLGFRREQVKVIQNGVSLEHFDLTTRERREQSRQELGLAPDAFVAVQVGRLTSQKGPLHGVRAAAALRGFPEVIWLWVGDGPLKPQVEREVGEAGLGQRFRLVGEHSDVRPFLRAADVFVFTSLHEGLGIAAIEAMATGLPIVAYCTGPLPEVVADGETGVLVPFGEAGSVAAAIVALLSDRHRARRMGKDGRRRAETHFDADANALTHLGFYQAILLRA